MGIFGKGGSKSSRQGSRDPQVVPVEPKSGKSRSLLSRIGFKTDPIPKHAAFEVPSTQEKMVRLFPTQEAQASRSSSPEFGQQHFTDAVDLTDEYYQLELMLRHIYKRSRANGWFSEDEHDNTMKVALRTSEATADMEATYLTAPHIQEQLVEHEAPITLLDLAGFLNCEALICIKNRVTSTLLRHLPPSVNVIILDSSTQLQVIDTLEDFMSLRRAQSAAFIRDEEALLIWSDRVHSILGFGKELEEKIVNLIWDEKSKLSQSFRHEGTDLESGTLDESKRTVSFITPTSVAISFMAIAAFLGQDLHEVILQIKADSNYMSVCIVLYFPVMVWLASFFAQTFSVTVLQLVGPVSQLTTNSTFYSGLPPRRPTDMELPQ